ncbi:MAG: T9SS type A sorting domain-containing protein [Candidatus Methylacidiphilales bacterium]
MKKITTTIFALMMTVMVIGQTRTLQSVSYRGAFEPGVTAWTTGWTNFDPQNEAYTKAGATLTISAPITSSRTWTAGQVYLIRGPIYVRPGVTLTIAAGAIIKGDASVSNSCLIVSRGAKINAQGTSTNPIVFTSSKAVGQRNVGDWGGVVILGSAKVNATGGVSNIEGLAAAAENEFGGNNDDDNSGVFSYVRIEFGGFIFSPDKEINGLTMGGVGRQTKIDHVQTSFINDDAFEWFGGTVNCTHLVSYRNLDDDMDTDFGYSGTVQFGLVMRDKNIFDASTGSTSEGFESDNDPVGTVRTLAPRTNAVFSNFTCVGPYRNDLTQTISSKYERGLRIRRNSSLRVFNSVFTDYNKGLQFDGNDCILNARNGMNNAIDSLNAAAVKYNVFASIKSNRFVMGNYSSIAGVDSATMFNNMFNAYQAASNGLFVDNITTSNYNMDYRPATGSALESGANFSDLFIASRTRIGLGSVAITAPNTGDSVEIANLSDVQTATITVGSIANADSYNWTTSAKSGVTFVSGQGTTSVVVSFATNLASTIAKPLYIAVQAKNNASNTFSAGDTIRISRTKPLFRIGALTSNPNNNLIGAAAQVTLTAPTATTSNIIRVANTASLKVGMHVRVVPGTTAGNVGTSNVITAVTSDTTFTVGINVTTALTTGGVLRAYFVPQNTFGTTSASNVSSAATYTSAAGATNLLTLVTVGSTTNLVEGMWLRIVSGTGTLRAGTIVSKIIDGTRFEVSLAPSVALSNSAVIAGYPLMTNICPVAVATGFTSEFDYTVVSTTVANNIGFKFDVPKNARICRVGNNAVTDYLTNRMASVLTTANSIGVVFDSAHVSGAIGVTPYNNAGTGTKFTVTVAKVKAGVYKVTSTGVARANSTVRYTASVTNGSAVSEYKWTIPAANVTAMSGSRVGNIVTTTTDTLSLRFDSTAANARFISGSLRVEIVNNCGTGTGKSFSLNGTTTLNKVGSEIELKELMENNTEISNTFSVFPNPNNGTFNVMMTSENVNETASLVITNILGQVVREFSLNNNNGIINTEINANLSTGIYFVKLQVGTEVNIAKISVN